MALKFPLPDGSLADFIFDENLISTEKITDIQTFEAVSTDKKVQMKLTLSPNQLTGVMHTPDGYFFIETVDFKANQFRIYSMSETDVKNIKCGVDEAFNIDFENKKNRIASVSPFPVGTQLRKYRLAAAATGEFVTFYSNSQTTALANIVSVINASNLIYELEAAVRFELIQATTTSPYPILFTNPVTDPFTPNASFASASASQTGFNTMNSNGTLLYSAYDVGHTFHVYTSAGISSRGQAGPTPCVDASKASSWTEWSSGASSNTTLNYLSMVVGVFVHEVAHQFSAPHTYNAVGGTSGSPTFCTGGWSSTSAVEPGSGTTLMGYGNNCVSPTNYTLSGNNNLQYFHTKSLEFIYNAVTSANCFTTVSTGNTPPVANAGADITIPKGTPFTLNGSATDADNDVMSYTWEQYDVATANDKGAFGNGVNGSGGYSAVNSTESAPLFRSEMSSSSTSRTFPKLTYILNNSNNPPDNEGEDLPQVARTMNFRFTVRDNKANGGGVDSDDIVVTVNSTGPFTVTAPNGGESWAALSNQTVTWNVNSTNSLAANVDIWLSVDGGYTFPYLLLSNTPNDGSQSVTLPNAPASTQARIKVVANLNADATFFDISDANFTITSTCNASFTYICPTTAVSGQTGNAVFNLGLNYVTANIINGNSKTYSTAGSTSRPMVYYTDNSFTTCQEAGYNTKSIIVEFRVSQTGSYTISSLTSTNSTRPFSIFTSSTLNCANFVGGNVHKSGGSYGWTSPRTLTLNECTTYYIVVYLGSSTTPTIALSILGTGDLLEVQPNPSGFSYTYIAVNQATGLISAISSTSDFTTLGGGTYKVYGLQYANTVNPNTFLNQTLTQMYSSGDCLSLSSTSKTLNITANPCPNTLTLVSTADDITSGNITKQASATFNAAPSANIVATNKITGAGTKATYQAKSILLNAGFMAEAGTIFRAEVGGCN